MQLSADAFDGCPSPNTLCPSYAYLSGRVTTNTRCVTWRQVCPFFGSGRGALCCAFGLWAPLRGCAQAYASDLPGRPGTYASRTSCVVSRHGSRGRDGTPAQFGSVCLSSEEGNDSSTRKHVLADIPSGCAVDSTSSSFGRNGRNGNKRGRFRVNS